MDLAQLRYFLRVAECSSFTQAATKCAVSQPALSQQIAKLEKEFSQPLFERQARNLVLTPSGQLFRDYAERILQLVEDAKKQLTDNGCGGKLHLAVVPDVAVFLTQSLLPNLQAEFSETEMLVTEQPLEILVRRCERGEFDVLFLPLPIKRAADFQIEELVEDELQLVLRSDNPLAMKKDLQISDIVGQRVVMLNDYHSLTKWLVDIFNERQLRFKITARVDQISTLLKLVELGKGVALLPKTSIPDGPGLGLKTCELSDDGLSRKIAMCWNAGRYQTQLVSNFMKAIRLMADPRCHAASPDPKDAGSRRIVVK
jgi:DNA-binding transcriptional LysR family regulator